MGPELAKTLLEFLKLTPRYLIAIAIIAALFLFPSDRFLGALGVQQFAQDNRTWIAITFLVSGVLFTVDAVTRIIQCIRKRHAAGELLKKQLKRLNSLTEDEKKILRYYIANETRTNVLCISDGVVNGLVSAGIISQAHTWSVEDDRFAYNISDFSLEHLQKNKGLLAGSADIRTDAYE